MDKNLISYLITDPKYYSDNVEEFKKNLKNVLSNKKVDIACFRDKKSKNFTELAKVFVQTCKEFNIHKILINSDYNLAKKLGASGVHLNSKQFNKIEKAKELNLYIIISCHSNKDIENAQYKNVNAITYSPIFETPNKGEPKGLEKLKMTVEIYEDLDIIALGGIISNDDVKKISSTGAYGFASIRYFL